MPRQPASASLDEALTRLAALFDCGELLAATDPTAFIDSCIYRINDLTRRLAAAEAERDARGGLIRSLIAERDGALQLADVLRADRDARLADAHCPIHGDGHFEGYRCSCGGTEK